MNLFVSHYTIDPDLTIKLSNFRFVCTHMLEKCEQLGFNNSVLLKMISDRIFFFLTLITKVALNICVYMYFLTWVLYEKMPAYVCTRWYCVGVVFPALSLSYLEILSDKLWQVLQDIRECLLLFSCTQMSYTKMEFILHTLTYLFFSFSYIKPPFLKG